MVLFLTIAMILLVIMLLAWPLRKDPHHIILGGDKVNRPSRQLLQEEKASLLLTLRELDFDYETGKLSQKDYKSLRTKYEAKAVDVLKKIEALEEEWKHVQEKIDLEVAQRVQKGTKAILILVFTIFIPFQTLADSNKGEILGSVVERKGGKERPVVVQAVRLRIIKGEYEVQGAETITDRGGHYRFSGLYMGPQYFYLVRLIYQGVQYVNDPTQILSSHPVRLRPFVVFPATGNIDKLIATENILLEFGRNDLLKVTHDITIENQGSEAYSANLETAKLVELPVLKGAFSLDILTGLSKESIDIDSQSSTIKLKKSILPGPQNAQQMRFSYLYAYEQREVPFKLPLPVTRRNFNLLISEKDLKIKSTQLERQPDMRLKEKVTRVYSGGSIVANEPLQFSVTGLFLKKDPGYVIVVLGVSIILFLGIFFFFRPSSVEATIGNIASQKEFLLNELCRLEGQYQQNSVKAFEYEKEKERIRELLFNLFREDS